MIRIRSQREGFRRCGVAHTKEWKDWPDDDFTPEQIKVLQAEPMLQVEIVKGGKKADAEEKEPGGKAVEDMTVAELTALLGSRDVAIPQGARKPDLLALAKG